MNVEKNSLRYLRHFEDVADELLPASIGVQQDVYDILNVCFRFYAKRVLPIFVTFRYP
jgi:hypothetical protein